MKWISRIEIIIGVWVFISPWILGYASVTPALWGSVISGAIIAILGLWGVFEKKLNKKIE